MTRHAASLVIKVGGRSQQDSRLPAALAAQWMKWRAASEAGTTGGMCCVVHGGGDEVTALQRAAGIEPTFIAGRRVTRADDIDRLRMALSGLANKRLVAALTRAGVRAVGVSGEDGPLLLADVASSGELGAVGTVRSVDTALVATLVTAGYLPVIAPIAAARRSTVSPSVSEGGTNPMYAALNVNGDDAAAAIALAIGAAELLLVSDVAGVRIAGETLAEMTPRMARRAIASGDIAGGMVAKVQAAVSALESGVAQVRIGGIDILTDADSGTLVVHSHSAPAGATHATDGVLA